MDTEEYAITRIDVAKSQIDQAIRMYFKGEDPISIHNLAHSALEIFWVLNGKSGSILKNYDAIYNSMSWRDPNPEDQKKWYDGTHRAKNFFKHSGSNPQESVLFRNEDNIFVFIDALFQLRSLVNKKVNGATFNYTHHIMILHLIASYPHFFSVEWQNEINDKLGDFSKDFHLLKNKTHCLKAIPIATILSQ
ncbi:MAG: hypothetical protein DI598_17905 [Pseudopedobacter saltans]|uniref:Uncharacterized protein n=1 Tax=Pseudopedobacter saltans TaxID=151895 RepID=A0A2W5G878_9SPHI|nr:MAG: hypothetical protein DI598_17905 [Pseudopedobacter saltans]